MYLILFILLLILIIIITNLFILNTNNKKWFQCKNSDTDTLFKKILLKHELKRTFNNDWDIYLPCKNDFTKISFKNIKTNRKNQIISFVFNNGILGSKEAIWKTLEKNFGRIKSSEIMPRSYIFPKDIHVFKNEYNRDNMYILKSEEQRQQGLKLSNNYEEIVTSRSNGYKIVQEYINNPLLYCGYKINFRIYLLLIYDKNTLNGYIYEDGIISYSKKKSNEKNINFDNSISSFYTSYDHYKNNFPITLRQLKKKLNVDWDKIMKGFELQIINLLEGTNLTKYKNYPDNKTFQLFGVDFLVCKNNIDNPYVIEVNIGPGMKPYCSKDKKMRIKLYEDLLDRLKIINTSNNNFKLIYQN